MRALIAMLTVALGCDGYTDDLGDGGASLVRDTAAAEAMCRDERTCDELWGPNVDGCRAYLDSCLSSLTNDQRDQWNAAVTGCLATTTTCADRFACYAIAPRC